MTDERTDEQKISATVEALSKGFTEAGKLVEAGWVIHQHTMLPKGLSPVAVAEARKAFLMGAQHLFASIMTILDTDREPTDADLRRMTLIDEELKAFVEEIKKGMH